MGAGHLPTLRPPLSFWILRASLSKHNLRWRIFLETQQIRRLAYLPRMGKTFRGFQGMFSWFYFFISSLFIKPEVMIISYRCEYMHVFGYEMKFLLIWDLNKFSGLEFFCSPTIYLSFDKLPLLFHIINLFGTENILIQCTTSELLKRR